MLYIQEQLKEKWYREILGTEAGRGTWLLGITIGIGISVFCFGKLSSASVQISLHRIPIK